MDKKVKELLQGCLEYLSVKLLKDKVQTVQIEFSNGARGVFIGKACVSDQERADVPVSCD